MGLGILLGLIYIKINAIDPKENFIGISQQILGTYLGWLVGFIYSTFFLYLAARNIRDLAEQVTHFIIPGTKITTAVILITLLTIYAIYYKLETISRVIAIVFPFVFSILVIVNSYLLLTRGDFAALTPVLANGLQPISQEVYPGILAFPFAEVAILMMIIPQVKKQQKTKRTTLLLGIILASLILTVNTITMITTLNPALAEETVYPLIKSGQLTGGQLGNFNFFLTIATLLTLITKITTISYGSIKGYSQIFPISYRKLTFIILPIVGYLSIIIAKGYPQHLALGLNYSLWLNIIIGIYLPILLLLVYYLKLIILTT